MLCDHHSYFTNDELAELKRIYTVACNQLAIDSTADHGPLRERVAILVMQLARQGICDSEMITTRVLSQAHTIGSSPPLPVHEAAL